MKHIFIILTFFTCISLNLNSQTYSYPLNYFENQKLIERISILDTFAHTSFLPLNIDYVHKFVSDSDVYCNRYRYNFIENRRYTKIYNIILCDDLIKVKSNGFEMGFNLLIDYSKTRVKDNTKNFMQNTRGFEIHGTLGKNLSFYTDFFENQAYYVPYLDSIANSIFVTQGAGLWKLFGEDKTGKDFSNASAYFSYSPFSTFNIQLGSSKFFIGNGYRSILLSDNSYSYPFLKMSYTKNRFQYNILFTQFQSFKQKYYYYHNTKHGSFIFINYLPFKKTEIGLFEGIIWNTSDDSTYVKKFPALYLVPIPLLREAVYGFNSENNAVIGMNFRKNLFSYADLYSQVLLDDFSTSNFRKRYAYQIGIKIFDVFANKLPFARLFMQYEYNYATPYTYSHYNTSSSYSNMNQSLAHPLGSGFKENVYIIDLNIFNFGLTTKFNNILTAYDINGSNFGTNILLSDKNADFKHTQKIGQGNPTLIKFLNIEFYYEINTKTHLKIFTEISKRKMQNDFTKNQLFFVSFGIKNSLKNFYTDL